ncbi:dockerin type I domain-containing protein [Massilia jejuensis]|uniref:Dockerin type I domain-containing protein n=1 Tax=Massilia jejuensis TaxID=648894 RepID=A0ABW0PN37_9BURK
MNASRLPRLAQAILCVFCLQNANAFVPSTALGSVTPGESHSAITKTALAQVYKDLSLTTVSSTMNDASEQIRDGNAEVDEIFSKDSAYHCDGENISACSTNIVKHVNQAVADLGANNLDAARKNVGMALHTLQDFYSHSNWIELDNTGVHPQVGFSSVVGGQAGIAEPTCAAVSAINGCARDNLITRSLTSGYFAGQNRNLLPGKCRHGGGFDGSPGWGGINKDMSSCLLTGDGAFDSPHSDSHPQAAALAAQASVKLFRDLRTRVGERQYKALLGIGAPFAFAIDTTGSMGTAITGVRTAVGQIIDSRLNTPEQATQYVLAPFSDPTVPEPFVTESEASFKTALAGLFPSGGGDCPELAMEGLYKAVARASHGARVYLFTDASAKDSAKRGSVLSLAYEKKSRVFFSLFGSCSPYDPAYFAVAKSTGGQVFVIPQTEAGRVAQLADVLSRSDSVDILSVSDVLSGGQKTFTFPVDNRMTRLNISVAKVNNAGAITVLRPDGSVVQPGSPGVEQIPLSNALVLSINAPQVGEWKVNISGLDEFSIIINGRSALAFDSFRFVTSAGRPGHLGAKAYSGWPAPGATLHALASMTGTTQNLAFQFRTPAGTVLRNFTLSANDTAQPGVQTGTVQVPNEPFNVYAVGELAGRVKFQRVIASTVVPQLVSVVAPIAVGLPRGQLTNYLFKVRNDGAAGTFNFVARDDRLYITSVTPASATLASGASVLVRVQLTPPSTAPVGTVETLTFTAEHALQPDLRNFAVLTSQVIGAAIVGDLNRDGVVNCDDLGLVKASFGMRAGNPSFNPVVDLDNNGIVDARDLALVASKVPAGTVCK